MQALFLVLLQILDLYMYILVASAIFSWLYAFNVINGRNQVVATIGSFLYAVTEPLLRPIRRFMPNTGGIDLSFLVLWFGIILVEYIIKLYILPHVF
jgi:YggT family protein